MKVLKVEGIASSDATVPKITSVHLHGEGSSNQKIAILVLSSAVAGKQFLQVDEGSPKTGDRLILPFLKGETSDFSASLDDECIINSVDADLIIGYRCDGDVGSAGAPIVSFTTGKVIGVHSWSGEKARFGIRLGSEALPEFL